MKILITGASGWLGKSSFYSIMQLYPNAELYFAASSNKKIQIGDVYFNAIELYSGELLRTKFDGIVHLAFLTRDKITVNGTEKYVKKNTIITNTVAKIIESSRPQWITTVSSGAAIKFTGAVETNPYTFCKIYEEKVIRELSKSTGSNFSVGRLWGSLGFDMPINRNYAVSDFITQALKTKVINVNAKGQVRRRYVDSREFMQVCIQSATSGFNDVFESGGNLIEVGDLAKMIGARLNARVSREFDPNISEDDYFPNDSTYNKLISLFKVQETNFSTSLESTISGHIEQNLI